MNSSSETIGSGGKQANLTGNALEIFVKDSLIRCGYTEFWNHKKSLFENKEFIEGKQYAKQVPCGLSIYGTKRQCDFLVMNKEKFPEGLIIECKWQQSSGSVDEKYPFTVLNIEKIGVPTIILIDGGGYKAAALEWLREQVSPEKSLIGVYTMSEFQIAMNKGFL